MSVNYVKLLCNVPSGTQITITPSTIVWDTTDHLVFPAEAQQAQTTDPDQDDFQITFQVLATDNAHLNTPFTYTITIAGLPGAIPVTYAGISIPFSGGATQYLDGLI